jgi:hypothetical protein
MKNFAIFYKNCDYLEIELDSTKLAHNYFDLLQNTYQNYPDVISRDEKYYTLDVFQDLAIQCAEAFNWKWNTNDLSLENRTIMHKDIEHLVGNGYEHIPEKYDELVHNMHMALHALETGNGRGPWLTIEWYNDEGFYIAPEDYPKKLKCKFGDIKLQNPFVGHHPAFVYRQNDYTNVELTCKFHDFCKPGVNIVIEDYHSLPSNHLDNYKKWFHRHAPKFVEKHSWNTILDYTGEAIVGRVKNVNTLQEILEKPYLQFEKFVF